jgi:hypothetical protein
MAEETMTEKTGGRPFLTPMRQRIRLSCPGGALTQAGVDEVVKLLTSSGLPVPTDQSFEWQWCTSKGTLPKRLQRHAYQNGKFKLTDAQMAAIGTATAQASAPLHWGTGAELGVAGTGDGAGWAEAGCGA